jgi:hypothetical protein
MSSPNTSLPINVDLSSRTFTFDTNGKASLTITSKEDFPVAFKVKTNRRDSYIVKPAEEVLLGRGSSQTINVRPMNADSVTTSDDKFQIVFSPITYNQVKIFDDARATNSKTALASAFKTFWDSVDINTLRKIKIPRVEGNGNNKQSKNGDIVVGPSSSSTSTGSNDHFQTPKTSHNNNNNNNMNTISPQAITSSSSSSPRNTSTTSNNHESSSSTSTSKWLILLLTILIATGAIVFELNRQGVITIKIPPQLAKVFASSQ